MTLSNLLQKRIEEHRQRADEKKAHRLEDALSHIDEASPCTAE